MTDSQQQQSIWPTVVYVADEAAEDALTKRILSRLPEARVVPLREANDPLAVKKSPDAEGSTAEHSTAEQLGDAARFSRGKKQLMLLRHRGNWLEHCPGTSKHVCCNLWIVNPGEGCPLDCSYCYLQSYLQRNPTLKLFTNTDEMLTAVERAVTAQPDRLFRIGTGEIMDSLVWDPLTDFSCDIVPFFARLPNAVLELKTKSANVDNLVALRDAHRGRTVVSWSVNAATINQQEEALTASFEQRIVAAERVVDAGYRVGLHFDPLIHFTGWEDAYHDAVRRIFSRIPWQKVAWVSVSTLRYRRDMQNVMRERFPESRISYGEQFLAQDNKLRYLQPIRFRMVNFVLREIKAIAENIPVYMCMESSAAWHHVAGGAPAAGSELAEVFSRRIALPILSDEIAACNAR